MPLQPISNEIKAPEQSDTSGPCLDKFKSQKVKETIFIYVLQEAPESRDHQHRAKVKAAMFIYTLEDIKKC
jgi:hypothetical protein